jgi:DNA-directed RNA polymerase sigma subunit (sigma70/sigma32)
MGGGDSDNKCPSRKQPTLEEVQRQFEAIRKRIRDIERKALAKLQSVER